MVKEDITFHFTVCMILLIVESPSKCSKIREILNKAFPTVEYNIIATCGHINDLDPSSLSIDISNQFKMNYVSIKEKKEVISKLKNAITKAIKVLIATDDDREGESIAFHVSKLCAFACKTFERIAFHEITYNAIVSAVQNPRTIDMPLVHAQEARRALDRLIGFGLTSKIRKEESPELTVGRVQSILCHLVREAQNQRTADILALNDIPPLHEISAKFLWNKEKINATYIGPAADPVTLYRSKYIVTDVTETAKALSPPPAYKTSTFIRDCQKLKIDSKKAMQMAQSLYENGYITYMRTDSELISTIAQVDVKRYIEEKYGKEYVSTKTPGANHTAAHEAIRPTDINCTTVSAELQKVYSLIHSRTVRSQMSAAQYLIQTIIIENVWKVPISVRTFDGFLHENDPDRIINERLRIAKNDEVKLDRIIIEEKLKECANLLTEATLLSQLETNGIGRPSTYSSMLSLVTNRQYIIRSLATSTTYTADLKKTTIDKKGKTSIDVKPCTVSMHQPNGYILSDMGSAIVTFLDMHHPEIVSTKYTSKLELDLDEIAQSNKTYLDVVQSHYERVGLVMNEQKNSQFSPLKIGRKTYIISYRIGKFGPYLMVCDDKRKFIKNLKCMENIDEKTAHDLVKVHLSAK